jgi:hypothetical protein
MEVLQWDGEVDIPWLGTQPSSQALNPVSLRGLFTSPRATSHIHPYQMNTVTKTGTAVNKSTLLISTPEAINLPYWFMDLIDR